MFPLGSRLSKSVPSVALAATALVGGATVLYGGHAQALNCTFGGGGLSSCNYGAQWNGASGNPIPPGPVSPAIVGSLYGQWLNTNIDISGNSFYYPTDKQINFVSGPDNGSGSMSFDWLDVNNNGTWAIPPDPHSMDQWLLNIVFTPPLLNGGITSKFEYKIKTTDPRYFFEDVTLQSQVIGGASVVKNIYSVLANGGKGTLIGSLTDNGSINLSAWKEVFIEDIAQANTVGSSVSSYQNVFRQHVPVPGPLPLLAAGAAFSFTRKLRRRVKTFRMA